MKHRNIYLLLSLGMILWGFNVVILKLLVSDLPSVTVNAYRVFTVGLVVAIYTWYKEGFNHLKRKEWFYLFIAGFLGIFGHHLFISLGLKLTSAANGSLILALNPLTTSILAFIFLKENITTWRIFGIILGFIGVFFIIINDLGSSLSEMTLGNFYVFIALLSQSISFLFIRKLSSKVSINQITAFTIVIGGILLVTAGYQMESISIFHMIKLFDVRHAILFFVSAIFATAIGGLIWNKGISILGPGKTAIFINMIPIYGLIGSALFLREKIELVHILGLFFIIIGVLFGSGWLEDFLKNKKHSISAH